MINLETIKQMFRSAAPPEPTFFIGTIPVYVIEEPPEVWIFTDTLLGDD